MIKVLCETMTSSYSLKVRIMEYNSLESFKEEVLKHYPNVSVSLPKENGELWFGIKYGSTPDGFCFRWLMAIIDTERGCLYSYGDNECVSHFGLPKQTLILVSLIKEKTILTILCQLWKLRLISTKNPNSPKSGFNVSF